MHLAVITGTKSFINAACRHCDSGLLQYIYIYIFPLLIVGVIIRELQRCVSSCVRMTTLRPGDEGTFFFSVPSVNAYIRQSPVVQEQNLYVTVLLHVIVVLLAAEPPSVDDPSDAGHSASSCYFFIFLFLRLN